MNVWAYPILATYNPSVVQYSIGRRAAVQSPSGIKARSAKTAIPAVTGIAFKSGDGVGFASSGASISTTPTYKNVPADKPLMQERRRSLPLLCATIPKMIPSGDADVKIPMQSTFLPHVVLIGASL